MPTLEQDRQAALKTLRLMLQPDVPPTLSTEDLDQLLAERQVADYWVAGNAYNVGQVLLPSTPNGRRFRCIRAGTSGTTEPSWSDDRNARYSDGTCSWQEAGPSSGNIFDVEAAAHAGWMLKAFKATALYATAGSQAQQVHEQCLEMARRLRPVRVA